MFHLERKRGGYLQEKKIRQKDERWMKISVLATLSDKVTGEESVLTGRSIVSVGKKKSLLVLLNVKGLQLKAVRTGKKSRSISLSGTTRASLPKTEGKLKETKTATSDMLKRVLITAGKNSYMRRPEDGIGSKP